MSRSACTILGGMIAGLERKTATEFSFFAAVPIMIIATGYELMKNYHSITRDHLAILALGFIVAFVFAWIAVKCFIGFLGRHTLKPFAWYRLILAGLIAGFLIWH
jgi:undecaprenyl-diphosphatase